LKASLITPALTKPALGLENIGRCTNERGKILPKAYGKLLPKDLTASLKGGDTQFIDRQKHPPYREGGGNFLYF